MLDHVTHVLSCPHCGQGLARAGETLRCEQGHSFDIARQGYASLLAPASRTDTADSAAMVAARSEFLGAGHFSPIADAVADAVVGAIGATAAGCVADIGAGTGYYLSRVMEALPHACGLALDVSKPALRRAARAHERIGAAAADTWSALPVADHALAAVLDIFAPRNAGEIARVLTPGGVLVVVAPGADHLHEAVAALGLVSVDADKDERLVRSLGDAFSLLSERRVTYPLALGSSALRAVIAMGPSARHLDAAELEDRIGALALPFAMTVDVTVSVWRPR